MFVNTACRIFIHLSTRLTQANFTIFLKIQHHKANQHITQAYNFSYNPWPVIFFLFHSIDEEPQRVERRVAGPLVLQSLNSRRYHVDLLPIHGPTCLLLDKVGSNEFFFYVSNVRTSSPSNFFLAHVRLLD